MKLTIIYEDNHLLVLNKPAGLLTQPSGTDQDSLEEQAKIYIKETYKKPGNVFLAAVHRLDKPASGIVVFAKTSKALSRLNESLREKKSEKMYQALVEGKVSNDEETLENTMIHDDFHAQIVYSSHIMGKKATLAYRVLERFSSTTRLEINLITGRYHQIRLQLSHIGHPIVGDHKYGAKTHFKPEAIALHHYRLRLPHPVTKEWLTFESQANF